jgi:hypothetical protein
MSTQIDTKLEVEEGIKKEISSPSNCFRYGYIGLVILIVIVVIVINRYYTVAGKGNILFNLNQINVKGLIIYIIVVIILFCICMSFQSSNNRLANTTWDILHFLFYFFLAYFIPNNWLIILVLGACWELFEDTMGFVYKRYGFVETDRKKLVDILSNCSGYLLGSIFFNHPKVKSKVDGMFSSIFRTSK